MKNYVDKKTLLTKNHLDLLFNVKRKYHCKLFELYFV